MKLFLLLFCFGTFIINAKAQAQEPADQPAATQSQAHKHKHKKSHKASAAKHKKHKKDAATPAAKNDTTDGADKQIQKADAEETPSNDMQD